MRKAVMLLSLMVALSVVATVFVVCGASDELDLDDTYAGGPVWARDGWVYYRESFGSDVGGSLMRVRRDHAAERVDLSLPGCLTHDLDSILPLDGDVALVALCAQGQGGSEIYKFDVESRQVTLLAAMAEVGDGVAWNPRTGVGYTTTSRCSPNGGIMLVGGPGDGRCFVSIASSFIDNGYYGPSLYFIGRCGGQGQGDTALAWDVCASAGKGSDVRSIASGFGRYSGIMVNPQGTLALVDGEYHGNSGLWMVDLSTGKVKQVASGFIYGATFSPGGHRIAYIGESGVLLWRHRFVKLLSPN